MEAILLCNDKRRAEYMGDSKMLLREVGHACRTHTCLPIRACQARDHTPPNTQPVPPTHTYTQMMRIREEDFWRTLEVYRECSGSRDELSRRVVQKHLRDNRCVLYVCVL